MLDLVVRNAVLPDGRDAITIGCENGRIVSLGREAGVEARRVIDAGGCLVSPPFVDAHFHMDSTLTYGRPRVNRSGTLLEGIELWGELKPSLTHEEIRERALELCRWAVARGTLAIRSHVDVCDPSLRAVKALLEVRELIKAEIDLQLVAFPQDGFLRSPVGETGLTKALDLGVEDRKSTRLNSSHVRISYAVFCLKKKKKHSPRSADPTERTKNKKQH